MKACAGEVTQGTRVIVVQVRDDHIFDISGIHTDACQCLFRLAHDDAVSLTGFGVIKAGIDYNRAGLVANHPHEEIHGHWRIVIIYRL